MNDILTITKRNGAIEEYSGEKIIAAMQKAFASTKNEQDCAIFKALLFEVEERLAACEEKSVERIQDLVEEALMEKGFFAEAKSYILFRQKRTEAREARLKICAYDSALEPCLIKIEKAFPEEPYSLSRLADKFFALGRGGMPLEEREKILIRAAVELISPEAPKWEFIAARIMNYFFHKRLKNEMEYAGIFTLYEKISYLARMNLYGQYILKAYTKKEIEEAESFIDLERDNLLTHSALDMLLSRYVIRSINGNPLETVQEMFLGIALHLAINEEKSTRLNWVKKFYDMMSLLEVTMATPTMANARKPFHQMSSCFIDTVPDTLEGIYRSLDNFARVSKFGGGMGLYFGKVRAQGSCIRGFEGAAGGVIRWIRLANDTAVAVDQLGVRAGACAVYLDAWHKDLLEFLQLRTNNGDDRMKAHDIFPAVCYPDLFWKMAEKDMNAEWHLMCPYEILKVKGYCIEDYYGEEWEQKYFDCVNDERISKKTVTIKAIVRLILKSAVETGTPFAFFRDTANKMNPNAHEGFIYSSNLCTEIMQNMSGIEAVSTEIKTQDGDTVIVTTTKPGDFVVCNLASLCLGNLNLEDKEHLQEVTSAAVRALDNVIDINYYPLPYAKITCNKYRAIGLGVSGWHHALAKRKIKWESEKHIQFADAVMEDINYCAIAASCELAKERCAYSAFANSDWQTGAYFAKRGYNSERWTELKKRVQEYGIRNGYLLAVAPTSSTSIISGTTPGIDPVMNRFFLEEKKGHMIARTAPELSNETWWLYKAAHNIEQGWSVKACAARQWHIDQGQSMNFYITNDFTMRQLMELYLLAWKEGLKSVYYVRSKALEVEECESCAS